MKKRDDNDDECLMCDAMVGAAVAVCQEFDTCRKLMFYLCIISISVSLFAFIFGGPRARRKMINLAADEGVYEKKSKTRNSKKGNYKKQMKRGISTKVRQKKPGTKKSLDKACKGLVKRQKRP